VLSLGVSAPVSADEILFLNGDRLTGTIVGAAGGKLTIKTDTAGTVTVDLAKVRTFSTTAPVLIRLGDRTTISSPVTAGADGTIQAVPVPGGVAQTIGLKDVTAINPPPAGWTGAIAANGIFTTGNAETTNIGISANAVRRSEHDRLTLGAGYLYGRQRDPDTEEDETTVDNVFGAAKYDYFITDRTYLFGTVRAERDRIADLDLRFVPAVGVGYQWFEGPTFNLSTEVGLAWVYEDYRDGGSEEHFAGRLAYHVDYRPHEIILLFHNLEWLPSVEEPFGDYNLNGDAGVRATITGGLFTEFRIEMRYDATPAPGNDKLDSRYLVSVGWAF
jgi:putative salt-induced outer membrane protein YdiY